MKTSEINFRKALVDEHYDLLGNHGLIYKFKAKRLKAAKKPIEYGIETLEEIADELASEATRCEAGHFVNDDDMQNYALGARILHDQINSDPEKVAQWVARLKYIVGLIRHFLHPKNPEYSDINKYSSKPHTKKQTICYCCCD